jgi:DNA-binding transcriptional MerR regulator
MHTPLLNPGEAARLLGISPKALRLYEEKGLLKPQRNASGWRFFGEAHLARARQIVALRALGLSLAQVGAVLDGDSSELAAALARHESELGRRLADLSMAMDGVRRLRGDLAAGARPDGPALLALGSASGVSVSFDLPWPWGGEPFALGPLQPVTWLTGPLGSGKTRLAQAFAAALPGGVFAGLDRAEAGAARQTPSEAEQAALDWLIGEGARPSRALSAVLQAALDPAASLVVFDLVEEGIDPASQQALGAWLRRYGDGTRPLIVMTRSTCVLDLELATPATPILYCPANHSPPMLVLPLAGSAGYEAVAQCLAPPDVRQRTAGMVAAMP